jgi:hypothetical protein
MSIKTAQLTPLALNLRGNYQEVIKSSSDESSPPKHASAEEGEDEIAQYLQKPKDLYILITSDDICFLGSLTFKNAECLSFVAPFRADTVTCFRLSQSSFCVRFTLKSDSSQELD